MEQAMACLALALSFCAFCVALLDHLYNRKCNRPVEPAQFLDQTRKITIPPSTEQFKLKRRE